MLEIQLTLVTTSFFLDLALFLNRNPSRIWKKTVRSLVSGRELGRAEEKRLFLSLFDAIYSRENLSMRRFLSTISVATFFVVVFYTLTVQIGQALFGIGDFQYIGISPVWQWLGYRRPFVDYLHPISYLVVVWESFGAGILPALICVAKTRWLLKKHWEQKRSLATSLGQDVILNVIILLIIHYVAYRVTYLFLIGQGIDESVLLPFWRVYHLGGGFIAYGLTLFAMSVPWLLLAHTLPAIARFAGSSVISKRLLDTLPFLTVTVAACLLMWLFQGIAALVRRGFLVSLVGAPFQSA